MEQSEIFLQWLLGSEYLNIVTDLANTPIKVCDEKFVREIKINLN